MRTLRKILCSITLAVLAALIVATPALADDYTYTVRIFPGNNGTIAGSTEPYVVGTYSYGDTVDLPATSIVEPTGKYYVNGYRKSGQDGLAAPTFTIEEDTDFVVSYALRGEMVTARINFAEYGTGDALTATDTGLTYMEFEGKPGDTFMVPYAYIEGFRPLYRNVTGTLKESGNEWTLEYAEIETAAPTETTTVVVEETTTTTGGAAAAAAGGAAAAAAPAAEGAAAAAPGAEGAAATPEAAAPATEEILDVDTPLAGPDGTGANGTGTGTGENGTGTNGSGTEGSGTEGSTETIGNDGAPLANAANAVGNNALVILGVAAFALLAFLLLRKRGGDETEE